ncbi:hypothetical protein KDW41_23080 [Burkholderia vietnamiensis]|nr:hypothetical protein [Burkholderia vietnamiensis]
MTNVTGGKRIKLNATLARRSMIAHGAMFARQPNLPGYRCIDGTALNFSIHPEITLNY